MRMKSFRMCASLRSRVRGLARRCSRNAASWMIRAAKCGAGSPTRPSAGQRTRATFSSRQLLREQALELFAAGAAQLHARAVREDERAVAAEQRMDLAHA